MVTSREPDPRGKGDAKAADRTVKALQSAGHSVTVLAIPATRLPSRLVHVLRAALAGQPLQIGLSYSPALSRRLKQIATNGEFDLTVAVHARAAAHIPPPTRRSAFAFIIDAYGQNYSTYAPGLAPLERGVYRVEAQRMRRFEVSASREFGGVGVVSEYDRDYLIRVGADPENVFAIPGGADVEHFAAAIREPDLEHPKFVFIGRLNYLPNRDAVKHLLGEIWPALQLAFPQSTLRIVGAQPGNTLRTLIQRAGVELAADVPDVRTEMRDATALLVPMRLGGGIQSKILEAMAARLPVVCSQFANLGIRAAPDEHLLIAESPEDYVHHASRLVSSPQIASQIAEQAYAWVRGTQSQEAFTNHLVGSLDLMRRRLAR